MRKKVFPSYKIAIQAVPERAGWADKLRDKIGGEIFYPPPGVPSDEYFAGVLESAGAAEYLVRIEDDAIPAPDFLDVLPRVLKDAKAGGYSAVLLYCGHGLLMHALPKTGHRLLTLPADLFQSGVGYVVASKIIPSFLTFYRSAPAPSPVHLYGPQDVSFSLYMKPRGLRLAAVVPSIIQHRDAGSLLGHNIGRPRKSASFRYRYGVTEEER